MLEARQQLDMRNDMWKGIKEFDLLSMKWSALAFKDVDAKGISEITNKYVRIVMRVKKNLAENLVINLLADPVYEFKNTMPVVTALRSKYLTEEHWKEIKNIMKAEFDINDKEFSLKKLLELRVGHY